MTGQPGPDRGDDRTQALDIVAKCHQQATNLGRIQPSPGTRRRGAGPLSGHVLDIKLQELLAEGAGKHIQLFCIRAVLG